MPKKSTTLEFVEKSIKIHNNRYSYDKSIYVNNRTELIITCKIHGDFLQKPVNHLDGCGCQSCDPTNTLGLENFIKKSNIIHNNFYKYPNTIYIKNDIKVEIECKIHGFFNQKPEAHLRGQGCPKCNNKNIKRTTEEFIKESIKVHGKRYDYSQSIYKNKRTKLKIGCEIHGIFEQLPYVHLRGSKCPFCKSSKMETYLRKKLIENNIMFEEDIRFENCRNKNSLPFDFYISSKNILIECDGIQHHKSIEFFGGEDRFEYQKNNDSIKTDFCIKNNIKLIRVNNICDINKMIF